MMLNHTFEMEDIREYALIAGELLEPGKDAERRIIFTNPSLLKEG